MPGSTISPRGGVVTGLLTTSSVYDLRAYDARTGAEITTFLIDPVLTIAVGCRRCLVSHLVRRPGRLGAGDRDDR